MQSPNNFYRCPSCGAEFSRPSFIQCAGANYKPTKYPEPKTLSCAFCGEALNPAALSVIRIEQPALVGVDEATVPDFLKPSRA